MEKGTKKKKKETKGKIIILEELMDEVEKKKLDEKEMCKIVLKCANCGQKDLLVKFLVELKSSSYSYSGYSHNSFKIRGEDYEKNLICWKCRSSLLTLDKEFTKENMVRYL